MPRDRDADKLRPDTNEIAFRTVQAALGEGEKPEPPGHGSKHPAAVKRGRKGGKRGGTARAKKLSSRRKKAIARKASETRWHKPPQPK
ncbi:MAG: hypothetical protein ABR998_01660 [Gemmatimonadales bacterium]|jgi:hypothetical protein